MVHDDRLVGLEGVQVCFDDERVVSDAGIALAATLAARLGSPETSLERLVALAMLRWRVEHDYRELKDGLGLDRGSLLPRLAPPRHARLARPRFS